MSEKNHALTYNGGTLTVNGVVQVVEIGEREAVFKLDGKVLTVRGSRLNVVRLDREQGVVVLETASLSSLTYRQSGLSVKGLFK